MNDTQTPNPAIPESVFWDSENAILRATRQQNPQIMSAAIEILQQRVSVLEDQIKWLLTNPSRTANKRHPANKL
jgi:hypothetical protein